MSETGVRHFGVLGYIVHRRPIVLLAVLFVATILILAAAGCAVAASTPKPTLGPPQIPHSLEGREGKCLLCHEKGVAGAPRVPTDHLAKEDGASLPFPQRRTNDMCTLCHMQAATQSATTLTTNPATTTKLTTTSTTTTTKAADLAHGEAVYSATCSVCHGKDRKGTPIAPALGPSGLAAKFAADSALVDMIRKGAGIMPGFDKLSDADLADLVAYLRSLQPTTTTTTTTTTIPTTTPTSTAPTTSTATTAKPADPAHGETVYSSTCSVCHGADRKGTPIAPALNTAGLAAKFATDSALVDMIRRGGGIMPAFDKLSDADLADLVAYLRSLQ